MARLKLEIIFETGFLYGLEIKYLKIIFGNWFLIWPGCFGCLVALVAIIE